MPVAMNSSRVSKLVAGLCCAAPLAFTVFGLAPLVVHVSDMRGVDSIEGAISPDYTAVIAAAALFLLFTYGVMIALMVHLFRRGGSAPGAPSSSGPSCSFSGTS